ncbi:hypothetical protein HK104_009068 [Borealophlyctis nickersoniae]|nr:hypothetical protein HK104_009068 [Borealophlyctis nickersoniae]
MAPPDYSKMGFTAIKVDLDGPVAIVTLNRPQYGNAWTHTMSQNLIKAYETLDLDDRVRVVVVTGAGKAFCHGADFREGDFSNDRFDPSEAPTEHNHRDDGGMVSLAVHRMKKVTIAAINGAAVGVGVTQVLPMDIRVAWKDAKVGFVFVRRGIVPEAVSRVIRLFF